MCVQKQLFKRKIIFQLSQTNNLSQIIRPGTHGVL